MAFDGIVINSVVKELSEKLVGGKINKVYQPEKDEIFIHTRSNGENLTLLLSASSNNPRIYLTKNIKDNPKEPPMFCMILRKHLIGSTILNIEQFKTDRIVFIDLLSKDELGINKEKRLVIEVMGRHSNIILIDKETQKVIDSVNRVSEEMSSVRQVFPGSTYTLPPLQDKQDPFQLTRSYFVGQLNIFDPKKPIFKFFYMTYLGLSPIFSKQVCSLAKVDFKTRLNNLTNNEKDRLFEVFNKLMSTIETGDIKPNIAYDESGNILGFHIVPLDQFKNSNLKYFASINELLDFYFLEKDLVDRLGQRSQSLRKIVNNNLDRAKNKLKKQNIEIQNAKDRDKYKVYADLISANLYQIPKGSKEVSLDNFYDPEMAKVSIPLDEKIPAHINAQKYYKKYSRLKNAVKLLELEIPHTRYEIEYLENVLTSINNSESINDLEDIKNELISENYLKKSKNPKKIKTDESKPHHFISTSGFDIFVGKNNRQNDLVTFKKSTRDDLWLHIQNMPGSHVIMKTNGQAYTSEDLEEAALLAAYYSSARGSSNISVDYTERKHVRKQKGAKAGLVFYDNFNTIIVTPSKEAIGKIKINN